jgi:hypothetical protein
VLWQAFKSHYGPNGDPAILVAQGASRRFNPSLSEKVVNRAYERDAISAQAEFGAQFRSEIEAFVSLEIVQACMTDHVELPPLPKIKYHALVDPSGGSSDSFTLAISHQADQHIIIDAIREVRPPFSPESAIDDFCVLLKSYDVHRVYGDRYAGEFPREV